MGRGARAGETVVVRGLCRGPDGVLLLRRAPGDRFGGEWELVGGKRDDGETAPQALRRETGEEAAIDLRRSRRVAGTRRRTTPTGKKIVEFVYESDVDGRDPTLSDEHDAHMWLGDDVALPDDLTDSAREALLRDRARPGR